LRALLIFLLCALPLTGLLFYLDLGERRDAELPHEATEALGPALLSGSDLADVYGLSPFEGALRRLDGFELRVVEEGYFKLYLRIERLGRHEGKPRLEEVEAAVFGRPTEGKPNLRLKLRAPFVSGDPRDILHAPADAPRIVTLDGGVKAFDALGRLLAEVARLTLDVRGKTATADVPIVLRLPERAAEIRAEGLVADLQLRSARLRGPVLASVGGPEGAITVRAKGGATLEEAAEGAEVRVVFEGDAEIEQDAGRVTCDRIDAMFSRTEGGLAFVRARLSGGVRLALAPGAAPGLESIDMPALSIEGEGGISCEGPLRATWRGRLPDELLRRPRIAAAALGDRTVSVAAAAARLTLALDGNGRRVLRNASFDAFAASDADGAGTLSARALSYDAPTGALLLEGAVVAETPAGSLAADRLRIERTGKDSFDVTVDGEKRVVYRADGATGPLGVAGGRELRLTAAGPLRVRAAGERISFRGEREVVASTDAGARLSSGTMEVEIEKGALLSFIAKGGVVASEPSRGAEISGERLSHEAGTTTVEGGPASLATKDGRSLRAPRISYREDKTFDAAGGVAVDATIAGGGAWRLTCEGVRGSLAADGSPAAVEAKGLVRALGPAGEEAEAESLAYDGAKGVATLLGEPARLRRGDEIALVAPKGLTLRLAEGRVAEGSSLGPSTIDYRPVAIDGKAPGGFDRWVAELQGPAKFEGDRLVVAAGARLRASEGGREALVAEAKRVELLLDVAGKAVRMREMLGSRGVRVESLGKEPAVVTADRLSFTAGTREVRVAGDAQVAAAGWPREVRFREVLFALTKDGIDLKRASDIAVR
jgi:hypothetical protein